MYTLFINKRDFAFSEMMHGYKDACSNIGYATSIMYPKQSPYFDLFHEKTPDLVFVHSSDLSSGLVKCLLRYPTTKLVLFTQNWNPKLELPDSQKHYIELLKNRIVCGFAPYPTEVLDETHSSWFPNFGFNIISLPYGVNTEVYHHDNFPAKIIRPDITYIGTYKPKCFHVLTSGANKVYGYGTWPRIEHLGYLSNPSTYRKIVRESEINLNFFSSKFILNDRPFKILACGGFCLSEKHKYLDQTIYPQFDGKEERDEKMQLFKNNPDEREHWIHKGMLDVYTQHTYYHRLRNVMNQLSIISGIFDLDEKIKKLDIGKI